MARQPWLVFGQMKTSAGVSANSAGEVLASVIVLTLLYGGLAVVEGGLMYQVRAGRAARGQDGATGGRGRRSATRAGLLKGDVTCISTTSGSSPSPYCGPATSSSRDSTSASASCCRCWAGTRLAAGS